MTRSSLLARLAELIIAVERPHPTRVSIDGVDGAGKTTLADELVGPVSASGREVIRASTDDFHNPRVHRYRRGRPSAEGYYRDSFDLEALGESLLEPLGPGGSRSYRSAVFDHRSDEAVDAPVRLADTRAVLLVDGVFLHRPELIEFWDLKLFVDVEFEVSVGRMAVRDGCSPDPDAEENQRYVGGQRFYLGTCEPKTHVDWVIDNRELRNPELIAGGAVQRLRAADSIPISNRRGDT